MIAKCKKCLNKWDYNGKYIANKCAIVTCPACHNNVKLYEKDISEIKEVIPC